MSEEKSRKPTPDCHCGSPLPTRGKRGACQNTGSMPYSSRCHAVGLRLVQSLIATLRRSNRGHHRPGAFTPSRAAAA